MVNVKPLSDGHSKNKDKDLDKKAFSSQTDVLGKHVVCVGDKIATFDESVVRYYVFKRWMERNLIKRN